MANDGIKITAPVDPEDIKYVLGVNSNDYGYLCSNAHGQINWWSKKKPVHILNSLEPDRNSDWWKGTRRTCGLIIPTTSSYINIPAMYTNDGKNGWDYEPPKGGNTSPYRIGDFDGYNHNAESICPDYAVPEKTLTEATIMLQYSIIQNDSISRADIGLSFGDVYNLGDWAFGAVIVSELGDIVARASSKGNTCRITTSSFRNGTFYVYPFFSAAPIAQKDDDFANLYCPLPTVGVKSFKEVSVAEYYGVMIRFSAVKINDTLGSCSGTIHIQASDGFTFINNYLQIRFATSNLADPLLAGEYQMKIEDITVKAGELYSYPFVFTNLDKTKSYIVYAMFHNSVFTEQVSPMHDFNPGDKQ